MTEVAMKHIFSAIEILDEEKLLAETDCRENHQAVGNLKTANIILGKKLKRIKEEADAATEPEPEEEVNPENPDEASDSEGTPEGAIEGGSSE